MCSHIAKSRTWWGKGGIENIANGKATGSEIVDVSSREQATFDFGWSQCSASAEEEGSAGVWCGNNLRRNSRKTRNTKEGKTKGSLYEEKSCLSLSVHICTQICTRTNPQIRAFSGVLSGIPCQAWTAIYLMYVLTISIYFPSTSLNLLFDLNEHCSRLLILCFLVLVFSQTPCVNSKARDIIMQLSAFFQIICSEGIKHLL